jgi:VanZ family protein
MSRAAGPSGRGPWVWRSVFVAALAGILVLALMPSDGGADWFPQADKLRHAAAFVALWAIGRHARLQPAWALPLVLLAFGIAIELLQALSPGRESSIADVLADAVGIAVGRWWLGSA